MSLVLGVLVTYPLLLAGLLVVIESQIGDSA